MADSASPGGGAGSPDTKLEPGDDAPPGAPGTGENLCPACAGSGRLAEASCPTCGGTGVVIEGIGGG